MNEYKVTFTVYIEAEDAASAEQQAVEFVSEEDVAFVCDINTELVV